MITPDPDWVPSHNRPTIEKDYIALWTAPAPLLTPRPVALTSWPTPLIVLQPERMVAATTIRAIKVSLVVFIALDEFAWLIRRDDPTYFG
jgi:hypothetical protein